MERKVIGIPNWTRVVMDIKDGRLVGWLRARGKYRNMSAIYRVSEGICPAIFREKSQKIGDISRYISDKLPIFPDISFGQRATVPEKPFVVEGI